MGAKMCSALTNGYALDFGSAGRTGLPVPPVNSEMVLKIPAAINPVYAGTVTTNSFFQHLPNCPPKVFGPFSAD